MSSDRHDSREPEGSWEQMATGFAELGDLLRSGFSEAADGEASAREELRRAWSGFVDAARDLGQALAATANDPELRASMKQAVESMGATVREAANRAADRARRTEGAEDEGSQQ